MIDTPSLESSEFDPDALANHLLEQGSQSGPAELHGCVTGLLATGMDAVPDALLAAVQQTLDISVHGELVDQLAALHVHTLQSLNDDDFEFYPLLPDDDSVLSERTAAMANWCSGFLAGFAHGSAGPDQSHSALPADSGEVLRDIAAIAQADSDNVDDDEDSEKAYAELVEYLRFAALNLYALRRQQAFENT
ncbi:MAG: UPF0149 family protein [Pseudomonadota bacterium]